MVFHLCKATHENWNAEWIEVAGINEELTQNLAVLAVQVKPMILVIFPTLIHMDLVVDIPTMVDSVVVTDLEPGMTKQPPFISALMAQVIPLKMSPYRAREQTGYALYLRTAGHTVSPGIEAGAGGTASKML